MQPNSGQEPQASETPVADDQAPLNAPTTVSDTTVSDMAAGDTTDPAAPEVLEKEFSASRVEIPETATVAPMTTAPLMSNEPPSPPTPNVSTPKPQAPPMAPSAPAPPPTAPSAPAPRPAAVDPVSVGAPAIAPSADEPAVDETSSNEISADEQASAAATTEASTSEAMAEDVSASEPAGTDETSTALEAEVAPTEQAAAPTAAEPTTAESSAPAQPATSEPQPTEAASAPADEAPAASEEAAPADETHAAPTASAPEPASEAAEATPEQEASSEATPPTPTAPASAPADTSATEATPEPAAAAGVATPVVAQADGAAAEAPDAATAAPAAADAAATTPTIGDTAPAAGDSAPAVGDKAPAIGDTAPAVGDKPPASDGAGAPVVPGDKPPLKKAGAYGFESGQLIDGTITEVTEQEIVLDLQFGRVGVINRRHLDLPQGESEATALRVGAPLSGAVLLRDDPHGRAVLSHTWARKQQAWAAIEAAQKSNEPIDAKVSAVVKGGLILDMGIRAFMPASHVDLHHVENLSDYVGKEIQALVVEVDQQNDKVVLSRRAVLRREEKSRVSEFTKSLEVGQTHTGRVVTITDFGAFVDVKGARGLLHMSEMAWHRIERPTDAVQNGQEIEVKIISIKKGGKRIGLSIRELTSDPIDTVTAGEIVTGTVTRLADFGAFVMVGEGVEGLCHNTELSEHRIFAPEEVVTPGEEIQVKIVSIDKQRRRVDLSVNQAVQY